MSSWSLLIELLEGKAKFFIVRDLWVAATGRTERAMMVRAQGDRRFFVRSLGLDPTELSADQGDWKPSGPSVRTTGAWHIDSDAGSLSLYEVEMPTQATGIRTGQTVDHKDPFSFSHDGYSSDDITARRSNVDTVVCYPVGPGLTPPPGLNPKRHGLEADLTE